MGDATVVSVHKNADGFGAWLQSEGRSPLTAKLYQQLMRHGEKGLRNDELAPKTRHTLRAALRAWAEYTEDPDLLKRVKRFKLPPAQRQAEKKPLPYEEWIRLRSEIRHLPAAPVSWVCGMLAERGFRVGDVLRLTRNDIMHGVATGTLGFTAKQGKRLQWPTKRFHTLLENFLEVKKPWKRVEDLVTNAGDKRKIATQRVTRVLRRAAERAGLDAAYVHPHRLRRTYAMEFLKALKNDPRALFKLLDHMGWENIETAKEYVGYVEREELADIEEKL